MVFKSIIGATCAYLAVVSCNATAIPTEADWKNVGDGLITYDANTGLEWLDLTETANMSYNDVSAQLGEGGLFKGWRYATFEVYTFWENFGVDTIGEGSGSAANVAAWDLMAPLIGDLYCEFNMCNAGDGFSNMYVGAAGWAGNTIAIARMSGGVFHFEQQSLPEEFHPYKGSALIRSVPEPSMAVLLASGLIVFGVVRRKHRT